MSISLQGQITMLQNIVRSGKSLDVIIADTESQVQLLNERIEGDVCAVSLEGQSVIDLCKMLTLDEKGERDFSKTEVLRRIRFTVMTERARTDVNAMRKFPNENDLGADVRVEVAPAQKIKVGEEWVYDYSNPSETIRKAFPDHTKGAEYEFIPRTAEDILNDQTPQDQEVIKGILRKKRCLMLTASSKAGKTMFLMNTAVSLATGTKIADVLETNECQQILYVDLEMNPLTGRDRLRDIVNERFPVDRLENNQQNIQYREKINKRISFVYVDGRRITIEKIAGIIDKMPVKPDVVIIDPIYKILCGEENDPVKVTELADSILDLQREHECAVIFSHHQTKGQQGQKNTIDRGSGSGVFGRFVRSTIDLGTTESATDDRIVLRMSFETSEFKKPEDRKIEFVYPSYKLAINADSFHERGSQESNLSKTPTHRNGDPSDRRNRMIEAHQKIKGLHPVDQTVTVAELCYELQITRNTLYRWVNENPDLFYCDNGTVILQPLEERPPIPKLVKPSTQNFVSMENPFETP